MTESRRSSRGWCPDSLDLDKSSGTDKLSMINTLLQMERERRVTGKLVMVVTSLSTLGRSSLERVLDMCGLRIDKGNGFLKDNIMKF